jgi:ATP-dependent helicase/nuclease subunit B
MTPFDPFSGPGPRWFSIPAHRPFLEDMAAGVLAWLGETAPEALSDAVILLPNRRAARAFAGALASQAGDRPVLLPQVRPLGDLEEDEPPFAPGELGMDLPPAIPALQRRFELARLITRSYDADLRPLHALELADALGGFLDSCALEEITDFERIGDLVEADLSRHWRKSARFLRLAVEEWPARLKELGLVDPSSRRATLLRLLADQWTARPPQGPVIAAGSTGTAPAAADVLNAVAHAPQGCVVLPGLDLDLDEAAWRMVAGDEQHPQSALRRLLDRHGVEREAVSPWHGRPADPAVEARGRARQRLVNEALRPADATADWKDRIRDLRRTSAPVTGVDPIAAGLDGLSVAALRNEEDAAGAIALMMRETLETPGRTCALVTPDLDLSRRVVARLERWGITADVSSGQPLLRMPAGVLIDLCARWMLDPLKPQTLLGLLKHPLVRLDGAGPDILTTFERYALRGPRPRRWSDLTRRLLAAAEPREGRTPPSPARLERLASARALADRLEALTAAARAAFEGDEADTGANVGAATADLVRLAEALCGQDVWAGPDGEAAAALLTGLIEAGPSFGRIGRADFVELVHGLLNDQTVRTGGATQPRLRILGAIEARLVRADRMILAGLEEGVWPPAAPTDPFLSRPMRKALGLPPPERRPGQSAQDFVQAACADEAILIHVERRGGQPAVRSRWLWRLEMLVKGADVPGGARLSIARPEAPVAAARALDAPLADRPDYAPRPAPRPPVGRRPRKLPVTGVERWVRDPYAVYAERILGLKALNRPGESTDPLERGNAVHRAVEHLSERWSDAPPETREDLLFNRLVAELGERGFDAAAMARETPLARNIARWTIAFEEGRRARGVDLLVEQSASLTFETATTPFTLTAKADRIEISATGGSVLDFKTGAAPSAKQVRAGFAPQLTLTAALLAEGRFETTNGPTTPEELVYVRLVGRKVAGEAAVRASGAEAVELAAEALEGLKRRVDWFDNPNTPYVSWAAPQFMGNHGGNYDHLARVWEWHVAGAEENGE